MQKVCHSKIYETNAALPGGERQGHTPVVESTFDFPVNRIDCSRVHLKTTQTMNGYWTHETVAARARTFTRRQPATAEGLGTSAMEKGVAA
jgi:hypothetical protein